MCTEEVVIFWGRVVNDLGGYARRVCLAVYGKDSVGYRGSFSGSGLDDVSRREFESWVCRATIHF